MLAKTAPTEHKLWNGQTEASEIRKRVQLIAKIGYDFEKQAIILELCKRDIFFWIENFVWTYDPRRVPASPLIPFILFPHQVTYLKWRLERRRLRENGVCEKSRDSGMSWINICHQIHCWLFEPNFKGSFGSRKEDLVDMKGNPDSLFEKIRILLRHLPRWMLPTGFDWDKHDNFKRLLNPANGSSITGESGDECGRGGRASFYDWDEVAYTEHPLIVEAALSGTSNTIYYTSSANGHNFFYQKLSSTPPHCRFRFFWRDDPRKDDDWYRVQCQKYDPVVVASEIDIDYGASVEGIYIPLHWVRAAINLELPKSGEAIAAMDVASRGVNLNTLGCRWGPVVKIIDAWSGLDTTQTAFKSRDILVERGIKHINIDADGIGGEVGGTFDSIPDLEFSYTALHGSGTPSKTKWPGEGKTSQQKFYNARAEWWGLVHQRFKKTYDVVSGQADWPPEDLISIPNHPTLITQISQPKRKYASNGKILVESKEEMRKRGLKSPDFADMLVYLFAPVVKVEYDSGMLGSTISREK